MKDINDILARYFSGNATPEDISLVEDWKKENAEEFDILSKAWDETTDVLDSNDTFKTFDHKAAWEKIDSELIEEKKETPVIKMSFYKKLAAACAILLVGLSGFWFLKGGNQFETVTNEDHQARLIELPDGSNVWLAANTTLEYHRDFENNRSLNLDGEAFFDVARDEAHPFVISTEYGDIEVLGTAFDVKVEENATVVSVDHGKVELRNEDDAVQLTAGESATSSSDKTISEVKDVNENYDSWKTGVFIFDQTPLSEAVNILNGFYEMQIELETINSGDVINGTIEDMELEEVINVITRTCDVEAEYGENTVRLK